MKKVIMLLLVAIAMQLNCGAIAAATLDTVQSVGDFPNDFKKKGMYYV